MVAVYMEIGTLANCNPCRLTGMVVTFPWLERKILTDRNAAPKSLGGSVKKEQEGRTGRGRRKIYMKTSERDGGGEG